MRQDGVVKRERAIAYCLSQQQWRSASNTKLRPNVSLTYFKCCEVDKSNFGWSWLEFRMVAKPWENRLMDQSHVDFLETTPSRKWEEYHSGVVCSRSTKPTSVKVRITPQGLLQKHPQKPACLRDRVLNVIMVVALSSSSSICTSVTPTSGNTTNMEGNNRNPNYMNLTSSIKTKKELATIHPKSCKVSHWMVSISTSGQRHYLI